MIPGQWDLKLVLRPKSSAPSPCPLSSSSLPSVSVDQGRCLCDLAFRTALALDAYTECYTTWPGLDFTWKVCLLLPGGASSVAFHLRQNQGSI